MTQLLENLILRVQTQAHDTRYVSVPMVEGYYDGKQAVMSGLKPVNGFLLPVLDRNAFSSVQSYKLYVLGFSLGLRTKLT